MGSIGSHRRTVVLGLTLSLLLLLAVLGGLNAFNLRALVPNSPVESLVFIALSTLAFLLFVGVLVLLVRNVLKLYADQRSRVLGSRLRTRMLGGAVLVSLVPLVFMAAFSYLLMNRSVDRWFSQPVTEMRDDANRLSLELAGYAAANARSEADSIALDLAVVPLPSPDHPDAGLTTADKLLERHEETLQGGFAVVYRDGAPLLSFHVPEAISTGSSASQQAAAAGNATPPNVAPPHPLPGELETAILHSAERTEAPYVTLGATDYTVATAALKRGGLVMVGLPVPKGIANATARLRAAADVYWSTFRERRKIRNLYMALLLLTTTLALFACCWLALNLSKQVTRPVESLAEAMEAIAAGDYARRVGQSATEELGELVDRFNAMAADLQTSRNLAEHSSAQLSDVNATLLQRHAELETIIETIPNGLVTLDADRRILLANRAFSELVDPGGQKRFVGLPLADVLPPETIDTLDRLLRRSHRMGSASAEFEVTVDARPVQVSATVALLESRQAAPYTHLGYVLVLEDATELLRAQKQSAWKEVARRVAHEIKNPLTPISLNAELIKRHIDRLTPLLAERGIESRSPAVIERSTAVISSSVEALRTLVDQFSSLAEFPSARPRPADLNSIVENALALFAGRLGSIRLRRDLRRDLPLVLADPQGLQRALSNLIDNAAEAMSSSLLRELTLSTRALPSGNVELTVADTGAGLTDEMRERLFLPYFSTKQRGTGLGLAIAAKVVQEHGGSIRAEKNTPVGACFIIELRPVASSENEGSEAFATAEPEAYCGPIVPVFPSSPIVEEIAS